MSKTVQFGVGKIVGSGYTNSLGEHKYVRGVNAGSER